MAAPNVGHVQRVRGLANRWGMDKLVLLVFCEPGMLGRRPVDVVRYVDNEIESSYLYRPNPHPQWSGRTIGVSIAPD